MLFIFVVMIPILALAFLVLTYVAFPHRGADVPRWPSLGRYMSQAAHSAPMMRVSAETTIDDDDDYPAVNGTPVEPRNGKHSSTIRLLG